MKAPLAIALSFGLCAPVLAAETDAALSSFIDKNVIAWASDPVIVNAIKAQNDMTAGLSIAEIEAMDQAWRDEIGQPEQPTIDKVINNSAADFLRARIGEAGGAITEIFVTDAVGLNVAASGATSDYWQGDEEKHSQTFSVGPDARHFSDVEKDESTGTYQAQGSFTIVDPDTDEPIGAMTLGVNAEALF